MLLCQILTFVSLTLLSFQNLSGARGSGPLKQTRRSSGWRPGALATQQTGMQSETMGIFQLYLQ